MIMWLRKMPSNVAPIPRRAARDCVVQGVGLELDPIGRRGLEGVGHLEELRLAIGAAPLEAGPTQVQPISSRRCSGTIDMKRLLPIALPVAAVDRREGHLGARRRVREGRLGSTRQECLVGRLDEGPAPQIAGSRRDLGKVVEVGQRQRLEADDAAFERDGLDPATAGLLTLEPVTRSSSEP